MESIASFIASRTKRFWIVTVLLLVVIVTVIVFGSTYTIYKISVSGAGNYTLQATTSGSDDPVEATHISGDIYLLPRSTDYIEARSGNQLTRSAITQKPFLLISDLNISISPQKTATKIGKDSLGCNGLGDNIAFTYSCTRLTPTVLRFITMKSVGDGNEPLSNSDKLSSSTLSQTRYKSGILQVNELSLFGKGPGYIYLEATGKVSSEPMSTVEIADSDLVSIIPDSTGGDSLALFNQTSKQIYFFKSLDSKPTVVTMQSTYDPSVDSLSCDLREQLLSCYIGPSSAHSNDLTHHDTEAATSGTIESFDFANTNTSSSTNTDVVVDKLCLVDSSVIVAKSGDKLVGISGDKNYTLANNIVGFSCGQTISYSSNFDLFTVDSSGKTSRLVFATSHLRISSVEAYGDQLLFSGFADDSKNTTPVAFVYQLGDQNYDGVRPEESLPFSDTSLFMDMDYDKSTIYIKPAVEITSNSKTGQTTYNKASFQQISRQVETFIDSKPELKDFKVHYILP